MMEKLGRVITVNYWSLFQDLGQKRAMGAVPGEKQQGAHFICKQKDSSWSCLKSHCYYLLVYFSLSKRRTMWREKNNTSSRLKEHLMPLLCFCFF